MIAFFILEKRGGNLSILKEMVLQKEVVLEEKYQKARDYFWEYCKLMNPKFYKDSRPHLKKMANDLQALYEGRIIKFNEDDPWTIYTPEEFEDLMCSGEPEVLVEYITCKKFTLNVPPRHGKSYIVTLFVQWMFGKDNQNTVITVTYNEILSSRFSANVRDGIDATKLDKSLNIFSDVFPNIKIKAGDGSKQIWSLDGQFFNYLGTGFGGTITGIGCRIGIIDDPVKNSEEAFNDRVLENQWSWYTDTFLSRIEEGGLQIIIMTRWSTKDLCGRLLSSEEAHEWYELKMKACLDEKKKIMLCPELLSFKSYMSKKKLASAEIHEANYQQEPVDVKGKLYSTLKVYTELPTDINGNPAFEQIINYTDTADTGKDFLCSITAGIYNGEAYILDVIYSDKSMEFTEPDTAKMIYLNEVNTAYIESNNGGRGFARNIERTLLKEYKTRRTVIRWFHQNKNKIARILSKSTYVMEHIYFPHNWNIRWAEFYLAISTYKARGKNKYDDAADALTGIAEHIESESINTIEFLM